MRQLRVVCAGAHPDDIEIGAGGLVYRLVAAGHDVRFLVLTDDPDQAEVRRAEAVAAAADLGLPADSVLFAGLPDGALQASRTTVNAVRRLVEGAVGQVDVVISHTAADSHNDHVQANQLVRAVFRRTVLLFYSVHISAELSRFAPRFYSAVEGENEAVKEKALDRHTSQYERLMKTNLAQHEGRLATPANLERAEAFEIEVQVDADRGAFARILDYNDSPFTSLWYPLIANEPIYLLYEVFDGSHIAFPHESRGRDNLRESFFRSWFPYFPHGSPVIERFSNSPEAVALFKSEHMLLAGGPISNLIYRDYFAKLRMVDLVVDYSLPDNDDVYVRRKSDGAITRSKYRGLTLKQDMAVLSILRNPYRPEKWLVSCAGVRGQGTRALLEFLAVPGAHPELMRHVQAALSHGGIQVLVSADAETLDLDILEILAVPEVGG